MIAEFVDGILLAIREATVEELRELYARPASGLRLFVPLVPLVPRSEPEAAPPSLPARSGRPGRGEHSAALRRSIEASLLSSAPPSAVAEITDPESLLLLGDHNGSSASSIETFRMVPATPRPAPPPPISVALLEPPSRSNGHAEGEAGPASGIRPLWEGSTVRLSDNESFARVSTSGVVIRRKKKA